ncbi:hypothetical protein HELRODRAFT_184928 [Helobdella robusta]|uniref:L-type lectin-like domain-containing protein n=1 Tax=Helobdella robusta TaxID=6412 RepID=T1FM62_HELRO|nr:hypothetical protein HELRODRAFT_184928 [Helobdella robusta]ESO06378.1 hypothetical protein HELRODRAFT_184928 [Helobdella robusta]
MLLSFWSTIFCLVLSTILLIALVNSDANSNKNYLRKEHSLMKPYKDDRWNLLGSAMFLNNYVRLTPDQQSRKGAVWNSVPCRTINWELHVHFKVHGAGTDLAGDGFAIWYVRDAMKLGPVFGSIDNFYGLGIFFDTYSNYHEKHKHGFPYISVMVNNGSLHYDHDSDGTGTEVAGCEAHFRNLKVETFIAIRYENNKLTISLDIDGKNTWRTCLKVDNILLPTGLFFGASAATGGLSDNHDLITFKMYDVGTAEHEDEDEINGRMAIVPSLEGFEYEDFTKTEKVVKESWSFLFILFVIFMVVVCLVLAAVGIYYFYESRQNKKRFY